MRLSLDFQELADGAGRELGPSGWLRIDQDRVSDFAKATRDEQWIHIDEARARSGPFGGTIAHGYLTLSLVSSFIFDTLEIRGAGLVINYGLERLRFPTPVPVGSEIRFVGRIADVSEKAGGLLYRLDTTIEIRDAERPALVADILFLALPPE